MGITIISRVTQEFNFGHRKWAIIPCCHRLKKKIKLDEDSIRIYPITRHTLQQVTTWAIGNNLTQLPSSTII
ncbi:MAG TPA: CRISPR-associated endonuclease Cas2 [Coleofasciculaceae cyanobacterium]